jgi:hypothetical protein
MLNPTPETCMAETVTAELPVLVRVRGCEVDWPTCWLPKLKLELLAARTAAVEFEGVVALLFDVEVGVVASFVELFVELEFAAVLLLAFDEGIELLPAGPRVPAQPMVPRVMNRPRAIARVANPLRRTEADLISPPFAFATCWLMLAIFASPTF